jgi:hypothetical protein
LRILGRRIFLRHVGSRAIVGAAVVGLAVVDRRLVRHGTVVVGRRIFERRLVRIIGHRVDRRVIRRFRHRLLLGIRIRVGRDAGFAIRHAAVRTIAVDRIGITASGSVVAGQRLLTASGGVVAGLRLVTAKGGVVTRLRLLIARSVGPNSGGAVRRRLRGHALARGRLVPIGADDWSRGPAIAVG